MKPVHEIKRDVVRICRNVDQRQYVGGRDGNLSVRVSDSAIVVTPAGMRKGDVEATDLVIVDREGKRLEGRRNASSELGMHLRIYDLREDVRAIVHAHPPVATGFAAAGIEMSECVLPEVIVGLGRVPLARYAAPGTPELSASLDPVIADHDAWLLENHGAVTVGTDIDDAYQRMETVEHAARILLVARLLGGPNPLSPSSVAELVAARPRYGVREDLAACVLGEKDPLVAEIVRRVRARVDRPGGPAEPSGGDH